LGFTGDRKSKARALFPGDAEAVNLSEARKVQKHFEPLSLDNWFLLLQHHGAAKNLPDWFLEYIKGTVAISAPAGSKKHPSREVQKKLRKTCGANKVFCTSLALACREKFLSKEKIAKLSDEACFGDMHFRLWQDGRLEFLSDPSRGERYRKYGLCS
jgi:hypothetical protein